MKEVYRLALEKHQKKHPGCSINEKVCKYSLSKECIGKGDISDFRKRENICKACKSVHMQKYYEEVIHPKRLAESARRKKEKQQKKKRSISFKKGTKKN
jgi:hypothetical protein